MKVKCVHVSTKTKNLQYVFSGPKFSLRSKHQRAKLKKGARGPKQHNDVLFLGALEMERQAFAVCTVMGNC